MQLEPQESTKAAQRAVVLALLQAGPVSTVELREQHGILSPAARVLELRREYRIETRAGTRFDAQARPHRVAVYALQGAPV